MYSKDLDFFSLRIQIPDLSEISHTYLMYSHDQKLFTGIVIHFKGGQALPVVPQSVAVSTINALAEAGYFTEQQHREIGQFIQDNWDGTDKIIQPKQSGSGVPQNIVIPKPVLKN